MNLLPARAQGDNFFQESNKVLAGMASSVFSADPAGCSFQRGVEGVKGGAKLLLRRIAPITRRTIAWFCTGAYTSRQ